jgi:3-oxoadipate enol-lactonase
LVNPPFFGTTGVACDVTYREVGEAGRPTLILANSLGTDSRLWTQQVQDWAVDRRVICFEYPGHGSPGWTGEQTMEAYAQRLGMLLDLLGVEEYDFCGLSMGGAIGMELALRHGLRMKRLVLSNTALEFGASEFWLQRGELAISQGMAALVDATLARWFTDQFSTAHRSVLEFAKAMFLGVSPQGYAACCRAIGSFDFRMKVGQISQRTLVIGGAHDLATPVEQAARLLDGIRNSAYVEFGTAHIGNLGSSEAFASAVSKFLQEI